MSTTGDEDQGDRDAIARLVKVGVDVTQVQNIEFHIAAPESNAANLINEALRSKGVNSIIYHDEGEPDENGIIDPNDGEFGPSWTVTATIPVVPSLPELLRLQSELNAIAQPFGGYSDGWGMIYDPTEYE